MNVNWLQIFLSRAALWLGMLKPSTGHLHLVFDLAPRHLLYLPSSICLFKNSTLPFVLSAAYFILHSPLTPFFLSLAFSKNKANYVLERTLISKAQEKRNCPLCRVSLEHLRFNEINGLEETGLCGGQVMGPLCQGSLSHGLASLYLSGMSWAGKLGTSPLSHAAYEIIGS